MDVNPRRRADALADLDRPPFPFADWNADNHWRNGILRREAAVARVMQGLRRINEPQAGIFVPSFTGLGASIDPLRRHVFLSR